jgi:hypothetical protein
MGILQDMKKLGIKLEEADQDQIDAIVKRITKEKKDETVRAAMIEGEVGDFLNAWCPEVMDAILKEKQREANEWVRQSQRKFDEKGNRLCDEQYCASGEGVVQCARCGKYICREHIYGKDSQSCYDCYVAQVGKENT